MVLDSEKGGRVLGIDPGEKRFGLALSDPLGITAQGLETLEITKKSDWIDRVHDIIEEYRVRLVVLGLPLAMSGGEIEGTGRSRELAREIKEHCGVEVILRDERMTSKEAERVMRGEGRIRDAGDIDKLSAVLLLQGYLDERNA
ncbi:MAG: Holliday junction resolvase RuvX [Candidatus Krumholzibacteriota bacterium]|nr:Holliday junction resolvase RuvX [Candidatus Krumholzibacteriota bacterium]